MKTRGCVRNDLPPSLKRLFGRLADALADYADETMGPGERFRRIEFEHGQYRFSVEIHRADQPNGAA